MDTGTINGLVSFNTIETTAVETMSKDIAAAQVVTKTLDYANASGTGDVSAEYDFQKSVLSAVYTGAGTILDTKS